MLYFSLYLCFFFRQKTAYDMRISDWSSDVCSSDLHGPRAGIHQMPGMLGLGCAVRGGRNICGCDHLPQLFLVVTVSSVDRRARRVVGSGMFRPENGVGQRDRCHIVPVAVLGDLRIAVALHRHISDIARLQLLLGEAAALHLTEVLAGLCRGPVYRCLSRPHST